MILTHQTIKKRIEKGELSISPLEEGQIQPASVDLRLSSHFLKIDEECTTYLDLNSSPKYVEIESKRLLLPPGKFILAATMEYLSLPNNLTAFVEGRSSIGRLGLFIQNAGWVDPGFEGEITLELFNAATHAIELEAGRRICQLVFAEMNEETLQPYRGKYQGQKKATGTRIFNDAERKQNHSN